MAGLLSRIESVNYKHGNEKKKETRRKQTKASRSSRRDLLYTGPTYLPLLGVVFNGASEHRHWHCLIIKNSTTSLFSDVPSCVYYFLQSCLTLFGSWNRWEDAYIRCATLVLGYMIYAKIAVFIYIRKLLAKWRMSTAECTHLFAHATSRSNTVVTY
jgi:hypothetical protein